jgi:hypothetical protein
VALDSPEIFEVNRRITCISTTLLALEEGEEVAKTKLVDTFNLAVYNKIADLVERQNSQRYR